jgi:hypothetical protein
MPFVRNLLLKLVSEERAAAIEKESRQWVLRCPCGQERSVWDMGGLRYKAAGNPRRLTRCPSCRKREWHTLIRRLDEGSEMF